MFVLKNLFKFDADTGSNGSDGSNVDNTSKNQQEEQKNEQQNSNDDVNVENFTEEQIQVLAEKHGLITSDKLEEIIENRQKRWEKSKEKEEERSKLSVKEQLALELEEIKSENEKLKKEFQLNAMKDSVKLDLNKAQLPYNDEIINMLISDNEDDTHSNLNSFKTYLSDVKVAIEKEIREELKGATYPSFAKGQPSKGLTKADILAIEDISKRQQAMAENLHLFE